jgi:hypothetical protein
VTRFGEINVGRRSTTKAGSVRGKRPVSAARPPGSIKKKQRTFTYKAAAWTAGIIGTVLATVLSAWLTDWGNALFSHSDSNRAPGSYAASGLPPLSVIVDIDPGGTLNYALATPVTSSADQVTLESGTASNSDVSALITRHGGVAVGQLTAMIVLHSNGPSIQIENIQPQVLAAKTPPPTAAFLAYPQQGIVPVAPVTVNLNSAFPALMSGSTPFFNRDQILLSSEQSQTITATFYTTSGYSEFDLVITYITGGRQYQMTVHDPADGAFRLTAKATAYRTYREVYQGISGNQFEIADKSQLCDLFPRAQGC